VSNKLISFDKQTDDLTGKIDFVVCLGGDGTLLYATSIFEQSVPPVMAFHLGSLGFLTPFNFMDFERQVTQVLEGKWTFSCLSK
jgi:NAD+ kinase